ncbi:DoxX family protein [Spirosoma daeguense]
MNTISLYVQAFLYIVAGINHFLSPKMYLAIMPPYIPAHSLMVKLSGLAEVILGIGLLFPVTRSLSAWGIMLLLVAVFPANVYMAMSNRFRKFPALLRWLRLPLQVILIWWAYQFT